jgi:hypothetical protein
MESHIESGGARADAWLESFIDPTLRFAVRYAAPQVERVRVWIFDDRGGALRCDLDALCAGGTSVIARGSDDRLAGAIQLAADRLEVALFAQRSAREDPIGRPGGRVTTRRAALAQSSPRSLADSTTAATAGCMIRRSTVTA